MPTKYNRRRQRNRSRKQRGGALSERTQRLLLDQYNGITGTEQRRPTILELQQFMTDNQIEEPFNVVMDNIVDLIGRLLSLVPTDLTPQQRAEVERLTILMRS